MTEPGEAPAQQTQRPAASAGWPATSGPPDPPPSPYLTGGQTIPEAYPAPPQPGLPSYGSPEQPASRSALQRRGQAPRYGPAPRSGQPGGSRQQGGYGQAADPSLAERWRRAVGWVLDSIIISAATAAILYAALPSVFRQVESFAQQYPNMSPAAAQTAITHFGIADVAFALVYYWVQYAAWGTSLGKRAVGTRVVTADGHAKISVAAAGIRAAVFVLGPAILLVGTVFWFADNLWLLWDPRRQCLHDKAARTIVIKKGFQDAAARPPTW